MLNDPGCRKTRHEYTGRRYFPACECCPVDYTSYEVQDWFDLEDRLLDQFQQRESEAEQLRLQRLELRPQRLQHG